MLPAELSILLAALLQQTSDLLTHPKSLQGVTSRSRVVFLGDQAPETDSERLHSTKACDEDKLAITKTEEEPR